MSAEDLEKYETEMELKLYREYRDVVGLFKYVIETERRFYLTNDYEMQVHSVQGEVFFEVSMADAWVWDMYRPARFVKQVRVLTFKDVNIEELNKSDLELPSDDSGFNGLRRRGMAAIGRVRRSAPDGRPSGDRVIHNRSGCPPRSTSLAPCPCRHSRCRRWCRHERTRALGRYGEDLAARQLEREPG